MVKIYRLLQSEDTVIERAHIKTARKGPVFIWQGSITLILEPLAKFMRCQGVSVAESSNITGGRFFAGIAIRICDSSGLKA
uniref:Uncharacterized protein n=1 Tax=Candidatus Nitrotoga fabula TaxID=2182327 RepID=A0A2X0QSV3_9PROT|nr:protein of unknown function [Candidatus Nitrotoga fabula]